jgi:hypothetical protein
VTTEYSRAQVGFKFGPVVGENFPNSQTLSSPFPNSSARGASGYILGLRADKSLLGSLSLQTELLITQRTFQDDYTFPSGSQNGSPQQTVSWAEKLQYLQLPILLKLTPFDGFFQPYVFVGPEIGFKLSSSTDSTINGVNQSSEQSALFSFLDFGLDAGAGLQLQILPIMWLFTDVRYTYGLLDAYTHAQQSNLGNLSARDIKWMAGLMIGF